LRLTASVNARATLPPFERNPSLNNLATPSGTIERDWSGPGLTCRIRLPLARLAALGGEATGQEDMDRSAQG